MNKAPNGGIPFPREVASRSTKPKKMKDQPFTDVTKEMPPTSTDVEVMREDGTTHTGYWYKSSASGRVWVDEDSYMIKGNPVVAWRYIV